MYTVFLILHLVVCIAMIFTILLQKSKGTEIGAAFGGSSQTIFGSAGAATFLNKLTTVIAVLFVFTSLFLAHGTVPKQKTMMTDEKPVTQQAAPQPQKQQEPASAPVQKQAAPASPENKAPVQP
jgi:preprotein translocase subunit SecG